METEKTFKLLSMRRTALTMALLWFYWLLAASALAAAVCAIVSFAPEVRVAMIAWWDSYWVSLLWVGTVADITVAASFLAHIRGVRNQALRRGLSFRLVWEARRRETGYPQRDLIDRPAAEITQAVAVDRSSDNQTKSLLRLVSLRLRGL